MLKFVFGLGCRALTFALTRLSCQIMPW